MIATSLKWPDALPVVLYSIHSKQNTTVGLSPHEIITGKLKSTSATSPLLPHHTTLLWNHDYIIEYVKPLTYRKNSTHKQLKGYHTL